MGNICKTTPNNVSVKDNKVKVRMCEDDTCCSNDRCVSVCCMSQREHKIVKYVWETWLNENGERTLIDRIELINI